jgi:hypothetical protein
VVDLSKEPVASVDNAPLSFSQLLLVFLESMHPGSALGPLFTISCTYRLRGVINVEALDRAVADVTHRHEAIRTVIHRREGLPSQHASEPGGHRFSVTDLSGKGGYSKGAAEEFIRTIESGNHPWTVPPLLWVFLGKFSPDDAVLVLFMHHSASDAWSLEVVMQDLGTFYRARLAGASPVLPPVLQYGQYAARQQAEPFTRSTRRSLDYWRKQLDGVRPARIPFLRGRGSHDSGQRAVFRFEVPADLADAVRNASKVLEITPFVLLLSAYKICLRKITGVDDIVVPTLTFGRDDPETENMVGFFVNALILRTRLSANMTYRQAVEQVQEVFLDAYSHDLPILQVIDESIDSGLLLADEDFLLMPFQVVVIEDAGRRRLSDDCTLERLQRSQSFIDGMSVPLDGLWTIEWGNSLTGSVIYDSALLDEAGMSRLVAGFTDALTYLSRDPERSLSS